MEPVLRAIIDQVVYDSASVLHLVSNLPEGAAERPVQGGRTVRQLLGHMSANAAAHVDALTAAGESIGPETELPAAPAHSDAEWAAFANQTLPTALREFSASRNALVEALAKLPGSLFAGHANERAVVPTLIAWSREYFHDGFSIAEVLPEFWDDAMVLTWTLDADTRYDQGLHQRQTAFLAAVRKHLDHLEKEEKRNAKKSKKEAKTKKKKKKD